MESPGLICASILSKKLAAGLDALVLDVKTGSGAFLRKQEDAEYLAALMVATAEAAGTRTVALLTDMGQPLGAHGRQLDRIGGVCRAAARQAARGDEDLRELSLVLAGWMIHLGGKAESPRTGYQLAEAALEDGSALAVFFKMVDAQGGDVSVFDDPAGFHKPGATHVLEAWESGYITEMDTTAIGWAVQRLGAGREKAGEPVDAHAGIEFHARRGALVDYGEPLATLHATTKEQLAEPIALLKRAIRITANAPPAVPLVGQTFTRDTAEAYLHDAAERTGSVTEET